MPCNGERDLVPIVEKAEHRLVSRIGATRMKFREAGVSSMIEERRVVDLIAADGSILVGEFLVREGAPGEPEQVELILVLPGRRFKAIAVDCFEALILIRHELEAIDLSPLCWGASLQVYPSDSSRGQKPGDTAYKLTLGQFARAIDRVNIFESGPGLVAATVVEQEDFSRAWFDSLADLP